MISTNSYLKKHRFHQLPEKTLVKRAFAKLKFSTTRNTGNLVERMDGRMVSWNNRPIPFRKSATCYRGV